MKLSILGIFLLALGSHRITLAQSLQDSATSRPTAAAEASEAQPVDQVLPAWRIGLLDRAFEAISKLPLEPHIKNRSRSQEDIVDAALELGLPLRAERYADEIANWRRAAALADVAYELIHAGYPEAGRQQIVASKEALNEAAKTESQGWRIGRVRAKLATCYLALGEVDQVLKLQLDLPDSETAIVESAKAERLSPEAFDAQVEHAQALVKSANFEQLEAILATCTTLYERFFDDEARRDKVIALVEDAWKSLPVDVRVDTSFALAHSALAHDATPIAIELVDAADKLRHAGTWSPELTVTMDAHFAKMRAELGQAVAARKEAEAARALYKESRERITDIYRGRCLRPLAEAFHAMGADEEAGDVYAIALEEGFANPNGRPRAMDLVATCLSMARADFEPSGELWARMGTLADTLSAPW